MRQTFRHPRERGPLGAFLALVLALLTAGSACAQVAVVEFHHPGLDHYFITSDAAEIADLDGGRHPGWVRTGYAFGAWPAGDGRAGASPVCRFYGNPQRGLDSHFYTANAGECAALPLRFGDAWLLESSAVFRMAPLSADGACPAGTEPVYRLFNGRADANHRYTTSAAVYAQMTARGYVPEGDGSGPRPVVFCAPPAPASPLAPQCMLDASVAAPAVNTGIVLTARCTNAPTRFDWGTTGCNGALSACLTGATTPGPVTYTVVASNAQGPGASASVDVTWMAAGTATGGSALPRCTLEADTATPATGATLALSLACADASASVTWLACTAGGGTCQPLPVCAPGSATCAVTQSGAGSVQYAVDVRNATGVVRVVRDVTWVRGLLPPVCRLTPSNAAPAVDTSITLFADCSDAPASYTWTGCASTLATCVATAGAAGTRTYGVVAANAAGASAQATADVTWLQVGPRMPPVCTLSASAANPAAGTSIVLTAQCSGAPVSYAWIGCDSDGATCTTTGTAAGPQSYTVIARNDAGPGVPATTSVAWQAAAGTPVCTVTANATTLWLGQTVLVQASCTNGPVSYTWQNCASADNVCLDTATTPGTVVYTVAAANALGPGAPASTSVTWRDPTDAGRCIQFPEVRIVTVPWGRLATLPADYGGNFTRGSVLAAGFTVPVAGTYSVSTLLASATNVQSLPVTQQATLSREKCDFRPVDPAGVAGPIAAGVGHPAQVGGAVGTELVPGVTYYVNVRNYVPGVGATCGEAACNVQVDWQWPAP
ncbi:MAG: hypothetical protein U1F48_08010 [Burkholderiales bacterium]